MLTELFPGCFLFMTITFEIAHMCEPIQKANAYEIFKLQSQLFHVWHILF